MFVLRLPVKFWLSFGVCWEPVINLRVFPVAIFSTCRLVNLFWSDHFLNNFSTLSTCQLYFSLAKNKVGPSGGAPKGLQKGPNFIFRYWKIKLGSFGMTLFEVHVELRFFDGSIWCDFPHRSSCVLFLVEAAAPSFGRKTCPTLFFAIEK